MVLVVPVKQTVPYSARSPSQTDTLRLRPSRSSSFRTGISDLMVIIVLIYDQKWDSQSRYVNCDGLH